MEVNGMAKGDARSVAANTPETAETMGPVAGDPPELQTTFPPTEGVSTVSTKENDKPVAVAGYPDDLGVTGGYEHGQHTFVTQAVMNPEINAPEQKTVCAVCGAEVVRA